MIFSVSPPVQSTSPVHQSSPPVQSFSAILLSFGQGAGWDQLLCVITELPASFR